MSSPGADAEMASDAAGRQPAGDVQVAEAYAIAAEANKMLSEARKAVAQVRAARGYYDTGGMKGGFGKGKSKGKMVKGKGKSMRKGKMGPCFICGRPDHTYQFCPDRFSRNEDSPKGSAKGSPSSSKGKAYFTSYDGFYVPTGEIHVLSTQDCEELQSIGAPKVVLDTGVTESLAFEIDQGFVLAMGRCSKLSQS